MASRLRSRRASERKPLGRHRRRPRPTASVGRQAERNASARSHRVKGGRRMVPEDRTRTLAGPHGRRRRRLATAQPQHRRLPPRQWPLPARRPPPVAPGRWLSARPPVRRRFPGRRQHRRRQECRRPRPVPNGKPGRHWPVERCPCRGPPQPQQAMRWGQPACSGRLGRGQQRRHSERQSVHRRSQWQDTAQLPHPPGRLQPLPCPTRQPRGRRSQRAEGFGQGMHRDLRPRRRRSTPAVLPPHGAALAYPAPTPQAAPTHTRVATGQTARPQRPASMARTAPALPPAPAQRERAPLPIGRRRRRVRLLRPARQHRAPGAPSRGVPPRGPRPRRAPDLFRWPPALVLPQHPGRSPPLARPICRSGSTRRRHGPPSPPHEACRRATPAGVPATRMPSPPPKPRCSRRRAVMAAGRSLHSRG